MKTPSAPGTKEGRDALYTDFNERTNMTPAELEGWLETQDFRSVGDSSDGESNGPASGRGFLEIKRMKKADLSDAHYGHMRKVVNYIKRHEKQRPEDPEESRWRYSLMNWGHDPMK